MGSFLLSLLLLFRYAHHKQVSIFFHPFLFLISCDFLFLWVLIVDLGGFGFLGCVAGHGRCLNPMARSSPVVDMNKNFKSSLKIAQLRSWVCLHLISQHFHHWFCCLFSLIFLFSSKFLSQRKKGMWWPKSIELTKQSGFVQLIFISKFSLHHS